MTYSDGFLRKDPGETEDLVLQVARGERAPEGARARALSRIAAVPMGVGVAVASKTAWAGTKTSAAWLASKWAVVGLGTVVCALGVVQQFEPKVTPSAAQVVSSRPSARPTLEHEGSTQSASAPSQPERVEPANPVKLARTAAAEAPPASTPVPPVARPSDAPGDVERRRPSRRAFATPPAADLTREVAALKRARVALVKSEATQALAALDLYRVEFPAGLLKTEEAALRVETAFALGDRERALRLADAFLASYATSPLAARVRTLAEAARGTVHKP